MAQSRTISERTYTPGTYGPFELRSLPGNAEGFKITFTRVNWPEGECLRLITEWSRDNGTTWEPIRDTSFSGGTVLGRDGQPILTCGISQGWPGENDGTGGRRAIKGSDVRITATVHQTITTAITIEAI